MMSSNSAIVLGNMVGKTKTKTSVEVVAEELDRISERDKNIIKMIS